MHAQLIEVPRLVGQSSPMFHNLKCFQMVEYVNEIDNSCPISIAGRNRFKSPFTWDLVGKNLFCLVLLGLFFFILTLCIEYQFWYYKLPFLRKRWWVNVKLHILSFIAWAYESNIFCSELIISKSNIVKKSSSPKEMTYQKSILLNCVYMSLNVSYCLLLSVGVSNCASCQLFLSQKHGPPKYL